MPRNRTIYQSEALFVGPTPATGAHFSSGNSGTNNVKQLHRIQSINYALNVTRTDVNQFGQLAAISREIIEAPTVTLDFSYYLADGTNEKRMGLSVNNISAISGILSKAEDEKNYFILTVPEGQDAVGYVTPANNFVLGVGNGFISSYSAEGAVGGVPTATVNIEGLNLKVDVGSSGKAIPAVNPTDGQPVTTWNFQIPTAESGVAGMPTALRPGDITLELGNPGVGVVLSGNGAAHLQSFSVNAPLAREPLNKLGSRFSYSKETTFPVSITMNASALLSDLASGNLADILCNDTEKDLRVVLRNPACVGVGAPALIYTLKGAKLDSQSFSSSVGANKTVDLVFSAQVGGPQDTTKGLFISGSTTA